MQVHAACRSPGTAVDGGDTAEPLGLGLGLSVSSTVRAPLKRLRRAAEPDGAPSAPHELSEAADQAEDPVDKVGMKHMVAWNAAIRQAVGDQSSLCHM